MINIRIANQSDAIHIALLGRITYVESHGKYIENKSVLLNYCNETFSVEETRNELDDPDNIFWIVFYNELPIGYAKLELNSISAYNDSKNTCRLQKIYILNDFIAMKIGYKLLTSILEKSQNLKFDSIWLTVYIKNNKAMAFYTKNGFEKVGNYSFQVVDETYDNYVFQKNLQVDRPVS